MVKTNHKWNKDEILKIYNQPFNDLLFQAHQIHREHFDANAVQISTLYSIKTGGCPDNCSYCPQSAHYNTGVKAEKLVTVEEAIAAAKTAREHGATRFCMGAGWRSPKERDMPKLIEILKAIKKMGMETCMTLGMLNEKQVQQFDDAGLDYYNHNLDSSPEFYEKIISTRDYQDRLDTLTHLSKSDVNVCCGGIIGMGETTEDRIGLLLQLTNLPKPPKSVPINMLVKIPGTPLADSEDVDPLDFVRIIALARIMLPTSFVRLSAGRNSFSDELHALCFFAGANSIHYGEKLFITALPDTSKDQKLFKRLGISPLVPEGCEATT